VKLVHAAPTAATISFSSASYSRSEASGPATITVEIVGTITGTATIEYLTVAGTATEGATNDYLNASGVLTFTTSPSSQSFSVTLVDDSVAEPDEFLTLILRNPTGGAVLGTIDTATLTILNDDAAPTSTPTATSGAPPVYVDAYEPNNTLADAYPTASDAPQLCQITLWPSGDIDFFKFSGKVGSVYRVFTTNLDPGLDTALTVFDPQGNVIATNDDFTVGDRRSEVTITAGTSGFYYARIVNQDPSDSTNKTYCFEVVETNPPTPTPTQTPVPGADACEFNSTFETACLLGVGETKSLSFVPVFGSPQDTDVFRLWMKPGIEYTCETFNLSPVADTNMLFFDQNGNDFNPPLGNDDKAPGDLGSKLSYLSTYTGWLYIMIGPVNPPPYEESYLHTYDLKCIATAATATPTVTPTRTPVPFTGTGRTSTPVPTRTPFPTSTPAPSPTGQSATAIPSPTPLPPVVQFQPLPTPTSAVVEQPTASIALTLYYDSNENFMPELTEGIVDLAVALFDSVSGRLIAFGYTNEAGVIRFDSITTSGAVRVSVPFLNYNQIVIGDSATILLRVAPQPLPVSIP